MNTQIYEIATRYIVILHSLASMAEQGEPISDLAWVISKSCVKTMLEAGANDADVMHCFGGKILICIEQTPNEKQRYRAVLKTAYEHLNFFLEIEGVSKE